MSLFDVTGDLYIRNVLGDRGIALAAAQAVLSGGGGIAIDEGRIQYSHFWFEPNGERWGLFVISLGGKILTCWVEQG